MKDTDAPIVDMATLRRDLYFVMSLLLADKKLAKVSDVASWTQNFHETEVRRLMLWVAVALRGLLDLLEKKEEEELFREKYCGEYWPDFPDGIEEPLGFRQACNSVIHAKEILLYLVSEQETDGMPKRVYIDRITVRGQYRRKTTRAQLDIIKFAQIADTLINVSGGNHVDI